MGLPFDYAARNLARRPVATFLTALTSALVAGLLVATTCFVRGLSGTFGGAARPDTAILLSSASEGDVVRSAVGADLDSILLASVPGVIAASSEIHMGTNVRLGQGAATDAADEAYDGFVRGITESAFAVHGAVTLTEGRPPGVGEVMVGELVPGQLGVAEEVLALGQFLRFEGASFEIVGRFVAPETTIEAEIWTPLEPLRGLTQNSDSSVVFVKVNDPKVLARLDYFTKQRLDLELTMISTADYYGELTSYFEPIRSMAWALALLISMAALFGGANTLGAAVQDRTRELATLRAVGYSGPALVRSLAQEALLIAAVGAVAGLLIAKLALRGTAVRMAMSAFQLEVDAVAVLVGFGGSLALGLLGVIPAAMRVMRLPIASALQED